MPARDLSEATLRRRLPEPGNESPAPYEILQTSRDARGAKHIATAALFAACCSLGAFVALQKPFEAEDFREFPPGMEVVEPGWAWTTVPAAVRETAALGSTKLGVIAAKQRVLVQELQGVRARIKEPLEGWISCISSDGIQVVTTEDVDDELTQIRKKLLEHQKVQRDIVATLQAAKDKGLPGKQMPGASQAAHAPQGVQAPGEEV
mmetsp:Transcript_2537/g.6075  ORF Transcript_2537/g.6075 Transcript_2537/m.6075 type:complete len:206 (+) Transcript_2537:40-657(+)